MRFAILKPCSKREEGYSSTFRRCRFDGLARADILVVPTKANLLHDSWSSKLKPYAATKLILV